MGRLVEEMEVWPRIALGGGGAHHWLGGRRSRPSRPVGGPTTSRCRFLTGRREGDVAEAGGGRGRRVEEVMGRRGEGTKGGDARDGIGAVGGEEGREGEGAGCRQEGTSDLDGSREETREGGV